MIVNKTILSLISIAAVIVACTKMEPGVPADNELLDGPIAGMTGEQNRRFLEGDRAFNESVFTEETGLGPVFVATSCGSCHAGDGKGHPFITLTRFGQTDSTGNKFLDKGGPQLQHRSIPGYKPEVLPSGIPFTKLIAPINSGLGYISLVSDADLLAMADPNDANADGISGVPNWNKVPSYVEPKPGSAEINGKYICRFGKKGAVHNLLQQTSGAYNQDMGITSLNETKDVYSGLKADPEVSINTINAVVFYLETLKAPTPRNQNDATVKYGQQVFINSGCEGCHKQTLKTGYSVIEPLSNVEFHPYTDLLLHDMGSGLDDGYTEGSALTSEWKTPALWGLGLAPESQGGYFYLMHDGRAKSIEEAIAMHGGEATGSVNKYNQLSQSDRNALLKFLNSL